MLHEGEPVTIRITTRHLKPCQHAEHRGNRQQSLFGLRARLASHLGRPPLRHSNGYDATDDRPICFASRDLIPESFMEHAG